MNILTYFFIFLFVFLRGSSLHAQKILKGEFVANIGAQHIDTTNMNLLKTLEISTDFKSRKCAINQENIFVMAFSPKTSSNRFFVKDAIIKKIIEKFRLKLTIYCYEKEGEIPDLVDSLFTQFELKGPNTPTFLKAVDSIKTEPIKIINYCSKIKYIRFSQVQIVRKRESSKTSFTIDECDTIYYPVKITSSPSGARIFINNEDSKKLTPYVFKKNKMPSFSIQLKKKGYKSYFGVIDKLKNKDELGSEKVNSLHNNLTKENKDIWIFLGTTAIYGALWYVSNKIENAPKKIPSPPKFPNPK